MSNDNRLDLVNEFRESLINKVSSSVAELVTDELIKIVRDYDILKDSILHNNFNIDWKVIKLCNKTHSYKV